MRFLLDADLPRSAAEVIRRNGHEVVDVRDIGLGGATDAEIALHAREHGLGLITTDFGFADIRNYPPKQYPGLVVLVLPRIATADYVHGLLNGLLRERVLIQGLPGKLAIVEPGRVRLR